MSGFPDRGVPRKESVEHPVPAWMIQAPSAGAACSASGPERRMLHARFEGTASKAERLGFRLDEVHRAQGEEVERVDAEPGEPRSDAVVAIGIEERHHHDIVAHEERVGLAVDASHRRGIGRRRARVEEGVELRLFLAAVELGEVRVVDPVRLERREHRLRMRIVRSDALQEERHDHPPAGVLDVVREVRSLLYAHVDAHRLELLANALRDGHFRQERVRVAHEQGQGLAMVGRGQARRSGMSLVDVPRALSGVEGRRWKSVSSPALRLRRTENRRAPLGARG